MSPHHPVIALTICPCICGEDLYGARSEGIWTMGDVACEYRTCRQCHSTRAYMSRDVHPRGECVVYADPDTSEAWTVAGVVHSYPSLLDALDLPPPTPRAQIIRAGLVLAQAFESPTGRLGWIVSPPMAPPR